MSSLMAMSFLCSLGPVWYQPTILSLAGKREQASLNKAPEPGSLRRECRPFGGPSQPPHGWRHQAMALSLQQALETAVGGGASPGLLPPVTFWL